ncbi:hypothetical protein ACH4U3_31435 [Streptomyces griseoruber]|uniref:hypothetical protein n=1 Tax=Streptomyces griseoruber TaxID=1943 RepID=UPI0037BD8860
MTDTTRPPWTPRRRSSRTTSPSAGSSRAARPPSTSNGRGTLALLFQFTGTSGILSPPDSPDSPDAPEAGAFERMPGNRIADLRRLFDFREAGRADLGVTDAQASVAKRVGTLLVNPPAKPPLGSFGGRGTTPDDIERNLALRDLTRNTMLRLASGQQMAKQSRWAEAVRRRVRVVRG